MGIQEFVDKQEFEHIMAAWSSATGLAAVAVDADGRYISECFNFTDFCMKYTRGSHKGRARCEKCDREGRGVYDCHAGLVDFSIDLMVDGTKVGAVIGGQVLPSVPDEEKFRKTAREIGVDEEQYMEALKKVNILPKETIDASAELLGLVLNHYIHAEYTKKQNRRILANLVEGVRETGGLIEAIKEETGRLRSIQGRQKILALNAGIEAARAGSHGAGFAVVAGEVGKLSERSTVVNKAIEEIVARIYEVVASMQEQKPD